MEKNKGYSLVQLRAFSPLMIIFGLLVIAFVVLVMAGVEFPLSAQTFEAGTASRVVTLIGAVAGIIGGIIGIPATRNRNKGQVGLCAFFGLAAVACYCVAMVLGDGHTNPHAWILLGTFAIIPGSFGGAALRIMARGIDS